MSIVTNVSVLKLDTTSQCRAYIRTYMYFGWLVLGYEENSVPNRPGLLTVLDRPRSRLTKHPTGTKTDN